MSSMSLLLARSQSTLIKTMSCTYDHLLMPMVISNTTQKIPSNLPWNIRQECRFLKKSVNSLQQIALLEADGGKRFTELCHILAELLDLREGFEGDLAREILDFLAVNLALEINRQSNGPI